MLCRRSAPHPDGFDTAMGRVPPSHEPPRSRSIRRAPVTADAEGTADGSIVDQVDEPQEVGDPEDSQDRLRCPAEAESAIDLLETPKRSHENADSRRVEEPEIGEVQLDGPDILAERVDDSLQLRCSCSVEVTEYHDHCSIGVAERFQTERRRV